MNDFKLFSIVAVLAFFAMLGFAWFGGNPPPVSILPMFAMNALLAFWVWRILTKKWNALSPEEQSRYAFLNEFRSIFIILALFLGLDLIPHSLLPMFYPEAFTITIAHWTAHIFYMIAAVLIGRVAVSLFRPDWVPRVTLLSSILAAIALLVSAVYHDSVVLPQGAKMPLITAHQYFTYVSAAVVFITYGFAGVFVLRGGFSATASHETRMRGVFIAGACVAKIILLSIVNFAAIALPRHFLPFIPVMIIVTQWLWIALLGFGALYSSSEKSPAAAGSPAPVS